MCYHTTYLFSLCGHITISPDPVQNTPKCPRASHSVPDTPQHSTTTAEPKPSTFRTQIAESTLSTSPVDQRMSYQSFTTSADRPFPSPQEFEFAKQLHDSIPSSPLTPLTTDPQDILNSYASPPRYQDSLEKGSLDSSGSLRSPCPLILRHPMHTFILPTLCTPCQNSRMHLIARFEAETIKEAIDRETNKEIERKRISRRSAQKGKLIPLICVEEGRIRRLEVRRSTFRDMSEAAENTAEIGSEQVQEEKVERTEEIGYEIPLSSEQLDAVGKEVVVERRRSSHLRETSSGSVESTATQASAGSWSAWWKGGSGPEVPATPKMLHKRTDTMASEASRASSKIDWSGMQERWRGINNNVARDMFGRNVKGMNRIMGWDSGGEQESVRGVGA